MQVQKYEIGVPTSFCDYIAMRNRDGGTFQEVGKRLALVRRMMGLTQSAMAQRLNMPITRWNNYELGVSLIPVAEALKIKRLLPGLSTDWIYDDDRTRLTVELAARLDAAGLEIVSDVSVRKRGRPSGRQ